jgi:hypothetical protein
MSSRPVRLGLAVLLVAVLAGGAVAIGHRLWLASTDPRSAPCADPAPAGELDVQLAVGSCGAFLASEELGSPRESAAPATRAVSTW